MDAGLPIRHYVSLPLTLWGKLSALILLALVVTGLMFQHTAGGKDQSFAQSKWNESVQEDEVLQRVATKALEGRDGTILIVDPQTGRIRAATNPAVAFENEFAPGSTIKPFSALAALRAGIISADSRTLCREKYSHQAFHTVCSHPQNLPPFNPSEAIAYSCNYYFGTLGERMTESQFRATIAEFGFGAKTEINADDESSGFLGNGDWHPQNVLGDGGYLRVTPIQLLMAYSALVNGGDLLKPQISAQDSLSTKLRRHIQITDSERDTLLDGLRGAIKFGTASRSDLSPLPLDIMGKTGTSTPVKGFRTQGWFVGFANRPDNPGNPTLGILVFLKRGRGGDAAAVSRLIFEEYARLNESAATNTAQQTRTQTSSASEPVNTAPRPDSANGLIVSVHLVNENSTVSVPLEQYVLGVVATEGSTETQVEALKALAVASRTFTMANLGRHESDGYDFCTTTHCQRFSTSGTASDEIRKAVAETAGQVLRDRNGHLITSYFSASCGGETANIVTLWGARPNAQLKGVTDEYCEAMPHAHWTDIISSADLLKAVRTDPRTDVGSQLRDIFVTRRDETGRAEKVIVVGDGQKTVRGWDFKIIVGRALGWNLLKSSKFQISRAGSNFVFRGSGFGHGLGLCQEGAHVMGQRGFGYRQILAKYFPESMIAQTQPYSFAADLLLSKPLEKSSMTVYRKPAHTPRLRIAGEHFRVDYPASIARADAEYLLQLLESDRNTLLRRPYLPAGIRVPFVDVFVNETTGDFVGRTGLSPWTAAATNENRIELQPIDLLKRRGVLETTVRHELVHKIVESAGCGGTPRWLAEGLALYLAGEGTMIARFTPSVRLTTAEIESKLEKPVNNDDMRGVYASAYAEVRRLMKEYGEAEIWRRVVSGCAARS